MKKAIFILCVILISALCVTANAEDALLMENKCEEEYGNVSVMEPSWDGTKFYRCSEGVDLGYLPYETSADFLYELDIRFNNEGCGFSFMKKGKWNSCIRIKDGQLALQTGSNNFTKLCTIDLDKWYHFTFLGRTNKDANPITYGHIILEEYENGVRVNKKVFNNVNLRNNAATHYINVFGGCDIDNLTAHTPAPTHLELTSDAESVVSGQSVQFTPKVFYNELEMHGVNKDDIVFEIVGVDDEKIAIDANGTLTTDPLTPSQEVTVKVTSKISSLTAEKKLKITSGDIFTVTGVGMNDGKTTITQIALRKNYSAYKDAAAVVVTFYGGSGEFLCADFKMINAQALEEGDNRVWVNIAIPQGFDMEKGRISIFVVTSVQGSLGAESVKVKFEDLPPSQSAMTVITVKEGVDIAHVKSEDILFFDVVYSKEEIVLQGEGVTYVLGTRDNIDTLFEIIK